MDMDRLTTTLVLWFMYLAYIALHGGQNREESVWQRCAALSAKERPLFLLTAGGDPFILW